MGDRTVSDEIEHRVAMAMHSIGSSVELLKELAQQPGGLKAIKGCSEFYGAELALNLIRAQEKQ